MDRVSWSKNFGLLRLALRACALVLFVNSALAQNSQPARAATTPAPKEHAEQPKLTPQQERGLRLLKAAEAEAAGLSPDMRAYVLYRVSQTYKSADPKKAGTLSSDAFAASTAIDDPASGNYCASMGSAGDIKGWVQQQVLYDLIHKDKIAEAEELLPQAEPPIRTDITTQLVRHYIEKKNLGQAEGLLSQLADDANYPFGVAADLLLAMQADQSADRMTIFNQALTNLEQHSSHATMGPGDMGEFLERTWEHVPPALALEAIDKVLDAAKSQESQARFSMTTDKGTLTMNSTYQLRVFQLAPILEELDKDKAEALLRDNADVQAQLQNHPKGMQSLTEGSTMFSYGSADPAQTQQIATSQQLDVQIRQRAAEIINESSKDPSQAVSDAQSLPIEIPSWATSPRADTLLQIAESNAKKKPSVTKSALGEILKIEDQLTPSQMKSMAKLPEVYLALGDEDGAKKALGVLMKSAEKLYAHDTDSDDPNNAFKGMWPSTDLWRQCIQTAGKISPVLAEEIIAEITDPDIASLEKVAFAGALLGSKTEMFMVSDCRKQGAYFGLVQ